MGDMLYYAPGMSGVMNAQGVARLGLDYIGECGYSTTRVQEGPDGHPGAVFAVQVDRPPTEENPVRYVRDRQTWTPFDSGGVWLGYWTDAKPGPSDLWRGVRMTATGVRLEDGHVWQVPGVAALPRMLWVDDTSTLMSAALPQYTAFETACNRFIEAMRAEHLKDSGQPLGGLREMTHRDFYDAVCTGLGVLYRVSWREASALRLVSDASGTEIMRAMLDLAAYEGMRAEMEAEAQNKTGNGTPSVSGSPSTGDGLQA